MHALLERLFKSQPNAPVVTEADLQLAAASLLVEAIRADGKLSDNETEQLLATLKQRWQLDDAATQALHQQAHSKAAAANDLFQFTRLLCNHWEQPERIRLVTNMWHLVYSDGHLAPEEEALVRKIADLLYVSHSDFIRAKLQALGHTA